jgi:hypothetical protein
MRIKIEDLPRKKTTKAQVLKRLDKVIAGFNAPERVAAARALDKKLHAPMKDDRKPRRGRH